MERQIGLKGALWSDSTRLSWVSLFSVFPWSICRPVFTGINCLVLSWSTRGQSVLTAGNDRQYFSSRFVGGCDWQWWLRPWMPSDVVAFCCYMSVATLSFQVLYSFVLWNACVSCWFLARWMGPERPCIYRVRGLRWRRLHCGHGT